MADYTVLDFGNKPNAFVTAFTGKRIFVTKKGAEVWTDEELKGIVAHEHTHVRQGHTFIKMGAALGFTVWVRKAETPEEKLKRKMIMVIGQCVLCYICERLADRGAIKAGHGPHMASALGKLPHINPALTLLGAFKGSYHPSTKGRVKRCLK